MRQVTRPHETIAAFSGNVSIVASLKRINRLRRPVENRKAVDHEAAADFTRLHLRDVAREMAMSKGAAMLDD